MTLDPTSIEYARQLDAADPLAVFRERFYLPEGRLYFDGNSLGLLSRDAEAAALAAIEQWKTQAIDGWMSADPPWFTLGEELGARMAPLFGAEADEDLAGPLPLSERPCHVGRGLELHRPARVVLGALAGDGGRRAARPARRP